MKIVVLDAATLGEDLSLLPLYEIGEVEVFKSTSPSDVAGRIKDAEVVIINKIKLNSENFENEVLNYEGKVLIDFYADWCGPCRMLAPIIEDIAEERSDVKVGKVDVDEERELAAAFGVSSIPTVVLVKGGAAVRKSVGYKSKSALLEMLD